MAIEFQFTLRTPRDRIFSDSVSSLRIPTETGQVGLHPRHEATVLAIEPGLVLARCGERWRFMATSGGIFSSDGLSSRLLTPLAVIGDSAADVMAALDQALAAPDAEMKARARFSRLESSIVNQLRQPERSSALPKR